jgi:hypothetical protein
MRKTTFRRPPTRLFYALLLSQRPSHIISAKVSYYVPGLRAHSIPIALPRPPQTRAASFKRLYPK